jgi:predicted metal-dependent enzyme (double-stranded beta helix superfamily)
MLEQPSLPSASRTQTWQALRNSLQSGIRLATASKLLSVTAGGCFVCDMAGALSAVATTAAVIANPTIRFIVCVLNTQLATSLGCTDACSGRKSPGAPMLQEAAMATAFDLDQFIADRRAARAADPSHKLVREVVARAVSDPSAVLKGLGEPKRAESQRLYHSDTLTILNVIWAPKMTIMPHDHRMWAVIGVYSGREDNIFWRRVPGAGGGKLEAAGAKALSTGEAEPLGHNIIHSVTNPIRRLTGAIHVYGGDFFAAERSEWDPETFLRSATTSKRTCGCSRRPMPHLKAEGEATRYRPPHQSPPVRTNH